MVGVTVILLTCSYQSQEFVRVGYYVNNEYVDQEMVDNPPLKPVFEKVSSTLLFLGLVCVVKCGLLGLPCYSWPSFFLFRIIFIMYVCILSVCVCVCIHSKMNVT